MTTYGLTHTTVHVSALLYCVAMSLRLWGASPQLGRRRAIRMCWIAGCVLLWAHVMAVWCVIHHGSWSKAWDHTAQETAAATGVTTGIGIVFNFLTLGIWTADCLGKLNRWRRGVDGYLAFMWFQAAVVFPHSGVRLAGWGATVWLLGLAAVRHRGVSQTR
ncbi:MAG: hypothetical protein NT069_23365 [Planctomycetota bacterium]|nr:hypothetical protein [Planctomycetota bacterium]